MKKTRRISLLIANALLLGVALSSCNKVEPEETREVRLFPVQIEETETDYPLTLTFRGIVLGHYWFEVDNNVHYITNWSVEGGAVDELFEEGAIYIDRSSFNIDVEITKNDVKTIKTQHFNFFLEEPQNNIWWVRPIENCGDVAYEFVYCNNQKKDTIYTLTIIDKETQEVVATTSTSNRNYIAIEGSNSLKSNLDNCDVFIEFDGYKIQMS